MKSCAGVAILFAVLALSHGALQAASDDKVCDAGSTATNADCSLELQAGLTYTLKCGTTMDSAHTGATSDLVVCPGASPLGATDTTGMCATSATVTAVTQFGATADATNKDMEGTNGLKFTMPDSITESKEGYAICFDDASNPTSRYLIKLTSKVGEAGDEADAAFSPSFVATTVGVSAAVVGIAALF